MGQPPSSPRFTSLAFLSQSSSWSPTFRRRHPAPHQEPSGCSIRASQAARSSSAWSSMAGRHAIVLLGSLIAMFRLIGHHPKFCEKRHPKGLLSSRCTGWWVRRCPRAGPAKFVLSGTRTRPIRRSAGSVGGNGAGNGGKPMAEAGIPATPVCARHKREKRPAEGMVPSAGRVFTLSAADQIAAAAASRLATCASNAWMAA